MHSLYHLPWFHGSYHTPETCIIPLFILILVIMAHITFLKLISHPWKLVSHLCTFLKYMINTIWYGLFISHPISTVDQYQALKLKFSGWYGRLRLIWEVIWKSPYNTLYIYTQLYILYFQLLTIILITYMYIQKIMLHVHISLYSMYVYVQFYSANFNFPVKKRWNHRYIIKCKS